jgi:hypothetical protein
MKTNERAHVWMRALTKISLAVSITIVMAFIIGKLNLLDNRYVNIIVIVAVVIQLILFIAASIITVFIFSKRKRGIRIVRYKCEDKSIYGGTYILPENLSPTNPGKSALFEVFLEIENVKDIHEIVVYNVSVGLSAINIENNITDVKSGIVNNNFMFSARIIVEPNEKINFLIEKDATIKLFVLGEFYVP